MHRHSWSDWKIIRTASMPDGVADTDMWKHTRFTPMWRKVCDCGFEQWVRSQSRPKKSLKLDNYWGHKAPKKGRSNEVSKQDGSGKGDC